MNIGQNIDFITKEAEELKEEETPVSAPAPVQAEPKTEEVQVTPVDEVPTKSEADSPATEELPEKDEEKTAAETSARDKAMALAATAGRPTSTGIAAGAGLGTILAALGVLHRSNTPDKDHSVLSNPFLLGALGAAGGYLGGNAFERLKTTEPPSPKERASLLAPAAVGAAGTLGMGRHIAKIDQAASDKAIDVGYHKMLRDLSGNNTEIDPKIFKQLSKKKNGIDPKIIKQLKNLSQKNTGIDLDGPNVTPEKRDKFNELQKKYKRMQERKGFTSNLKARGLGEPDRMSFMRQFSDSSWNPLNQIKALNPFKNVEGLGSGQKLLKNQILSVLKLSGKGKLPWMSLKAMPPRLAALAALAGTGALGVNAVRNAVRNAVSED